jgi:hypothetical protein
MRYLFTLVGIYFAERFSVPRNLMITGQEAVVPQMSIPVSVAAVTTLAFVAWLFLGRRAKGGLGPRASGVMVACLSATLIFLVLPGWNYGATIAGLARVGPFGLGLTHLSGLALFAGAIVACVTAGQWRIEGLALVASARCLLGGYVMQTGAQLIPGGSDSWLFWTLPGGGLHGLMAYGLVVFFLMAWVWIRQQPVRVGARAEVPAGDSDA